MCTLQVPKDSTRPTTKSRGGGAAALTDGDDGGMPRSREVVTQRGRTSRATQRAGGGEAYDIWP